MYRKRSTVVVALTCAMATFGLAACGTGGGSASKAGAAKGVAIKVVYNVQGAHDAVDGLMRAAKTEYDKINPGVTADLVPIQASQNDYFTRLALMNRSASTAPDVIYEDSFMVKPDSDAGYLEPLDGYLAKWGDWNKFTAAAKGAGVGEDGKIYGVSIGTDTQGIWYNKEVFQKAGLTVPFKPKSWDDMLAAARQIKKNVAGVIPWNIYAGTQLGEAGSVRGFQTFLAGTGGQLRDAKTSKWVLNSQGFEDTLKLINTVFSEKLGPDPSTASDPNLTNTVSQTWLPTGKLGMVIDGSWLPGGWAKTGNSPWPAWSTTLGWAAIPTQRGETPGSTSMSGGWTVAMGSKSKHPDQAWEFLSQVLSQKSLLKFAMDGSQIAVREDVAADSTYQNANPTVPFFTDLVAVTHFRPATSDYQQISNQISIATEAVMTGKATPAEAQKAYDQGVIGIVGKEKTESGR